MARTTRFEEVVLPHLDAGYNFARWLARSGDDAEDIVQEACARALRYLGGFHGDSGRAWFLTIVRNAAYDWFERNRRPDFVDPSALDDIADAPTSTPEAIAIRRAEDRMLGEAIAALPVGFREVLILRELEELSYKEIARIADIPVGTVMSRLARARALLSRSPLLHAVSERAVGGDA
jgi:RNA polymerase sigma-70 factor (ECF subfamily)